MKIVFNLLLIMKSFKTIYGEDIGVEISSKSENYVEILVENTNFHKRRLKILKQFVITAFLHFTLAVFSKLLLLVNITFVSVELILLYYLFSLVETINITVIKDLAIQISTKYFFDRVENRMVSSTYIDDIVINEVILNVILLID